MKAAAHKKTILIVEDEEDIQLLLQKRLNQAGFHCVGSSTVEEGLKCLKDVKPDLVILDLGFKSASGIAFLQNMASYIPANVHKPPVMVLSAYGDPDIISYTKSLGVKSFITKPFDSAHILETVNRLF
jgi:DNA-binding response OmpR family regulator